MVRAACTRRRSDSLQDRLGITGIAGPGGATPGKKVGLTYVAVDSDDHSAVKKYEWPYDREGNRLASVGAALDLLEKAVG